MPWKEGSVRDQKLLFVADCLRGEESMTALCERYGISRQVGHALRKRASWRKARAAWRSVRERHCIMAGRRRQRWWHV